MSRRIIFQVRCPDTRVGLHLRVVGSCRALGSWDPLSGLPLVTSAADFPTWRAADPAPLEQDEQVEYKYVICDSEGRATRWEERANRTFKLRDLPVQDANPMDDQIGRATASVLTLVEAFNSFDAPQWHDENVGPLVRMSFSRQVSAAHPPSTAAELFAPTIRERTSSITSVQLADEASTQTFRSCSRSNLGAVLSEIEPQITRHSSGGTEPEAAGRMPETMAREESCSNLFLDDDADEDLPEETSEFDDRYALVGNGPLGEGTFGLVWKTRLKPCSGAVTCEGQEQERAAKIVKKARLQPREMRFLLGEDGEIQTHLTMKHQHIVELFEFFDEVNTVTLVLEYCRGGDLFDAVISTRQSHSGHGRGFSERAAAVVTRHLLSALSYIHKANIVHRDIKCENVLLLFPTSRVPLEENVYKLCDFGFATHDRGEGLTDRLGSPDTVAPDVLASNTPYSTPADIWSAGVLMYMMLAAMPPFTGNTDKEVLQKVARGAYSLSGEPWDSITAPCKAMMESMMTVDPRLRVTADQALEAEWLTGPP